MAIGVIVLIAVEADVLRGPWAPSASRRWRGTHERAGISANPRTVQNAGPDRARREQAFRAVTAL